MNMQLLQYQLPNNPLKLLDDYLFSLSSEIINNGQDTDNDAADTNNPDSEQQDNIAAITSSSQSTPSKRSAQAEQLHNSVLRVAAELFGNNISLLENSLALLEEQEQYQNNDDNNNNNNSSSSSSEITPPIRTIRAKRSGRVAVLVRKQRKNSRASNQNYQSNKQIIDDYYLCLLGRDRVTIGNNNAFKTSKGTYLCTPQHRIGMNCTCRSFFHNIKGSGGNGGRFKSNGDRSPPRTASSYSSNGNINNIVCKHLLAVILMPHLLPWRSQSVEEDVVDDKLFTKLVMRASIG
mmetsp:Transcript_2357/g.3847  ORF Transcript_2357/g.3847 Transcript_2357/m.3847 type:complete len:292 (+) Transcript_2357:201-1076(+)